MNSWILGIGDEILSGRVVNTNASYISSKLEEIGITTQKMFVVGDEYQDIDKVMKEFISSDCEVLITTGGLGPTHDDITIEAISRSLKLKLVSYPEAVNNLNNYFNGKEFNECNLKQTYFPKGTKIIPNKLGTACGGILEVSNKVVIILVGPPFELKPMFENYVMSYLKQYNSDCLLIKNYTVMGIGESEIEPTIIQIKSRHPSASINPYFSIGKIRFQITEKSNNLDEFNKVCADFEKTLGDLIISDENKDICEVFVNRLKELHYKVSFCESCTGGLLSSKIISVNGASAVIDESLVTYSNQAKIKYLNVLPETINNYDVASIEVAKEMVKGLFNLTNSNICISVTGVAGPTSNNPDIPVGSVFFGVSINGNIKTYKNIFKGDRELVRQKAAMWILYKTLLEIK